MIDAALRVIGVDLFRQLARLKEHAEDLKARATAEIRHKIAEAGITIALLLAGALFLLATLVVGLIALYTWVAQAYGPLWGLGAVALLTTSLGVILLGIAYHRNKTTDDARPAAETRAAGAAKTNGRHSAAAFAAASADSRAYGATERAAAATEDALDGAADWVRNSPQEAILATLAAAAMIGVVIGRRR